MNTDSFRSGCNGWVNLCVERLEGWREEHGGGWVKKKEAGGSRGDLGRRGSRWGAIGDVPFVRFRSPSRIDASEREKPREERRQRERIAARKSVLHWRSQSNRVIETVHGAVSGPFLSCLFFFASVSCRCKIRVLSTLDFARSAWRAEFFRRADEEKERIQNPTCVFLRLVSFSFHFYNYGFSKKEFFEINLTRVNLNFFLTIFV